MAGGGNPFRGYDSPKSLAAELKAQASDGADAKEYQQSLATYLGQVLTAANNRDANLVKQRLDSALSSLGDAHDSRFDLLFGGSVAKHTYVDGLSDVDTLVILNETGLEVETPTAVLKKFAETIAKQTPDARVSAGAMAVSVEFPDGMVLQLLPALRTATGVRVPAADGKEWSRVTKPEKFREALSDLNEKCGGRLVPVIKLAKAIVGALPESQRLSGYHMESLAIEAFKTYDGPHTNAAMLPAFFEKARSLVMSPIADSTGQSRHVDDYLGAANSEPRRDASHILDRIAKRMGLGNTTHSLAQWRALFGDDS
jgi:hypothetical protein